MPLRLVDACRSHRIDPFIVAIEGQAETELIQNHDHMYVPIGASAKVLEAFRARNIRDIVFIGKIRRPSLSEIRPDLWTVRFFTRFGFKGLGDNSLLSSLKLALEEEGFKIRGVQEYVDDLLANDTFCTVSPVPDQDDWADIRHGIKICRQIGALDIGQSIVVQEGMILGLEAIEGTDKLIERCAGYRRPGRKPILIKLSKPGQDKTLDLPTIGLKTIELCIRHDYRGIVIENGRTIVLDPFVLKQKAEENSLFIVTVNPDGIIPDESK